MSLALKKRPHPLQPACPPGALLLTADSDANALVVVDETGQRIVLGAGGNGSGEEPVSGWKDVLELGGGLGGITNNQVEISELYDDVLTTGATGTSMAFPLDAAEEVLQLRGRLRLVCYCDDGTPENSWGTVTVVIGASRTQELPIGHYIIDFDIPTRHIDVSLRHGFMDIRVERTTGTQAMHVNLALLTLQARTQPVGMTVDTTFDFDKGSITLVSGPASEGLLFTAADNPVLSTATSVEVLGYYALGSVLPPEWPVPWPSAMAGYTVVMLRFVYTAVEPIGMNPDENGNWAVDPRPVIPAGRHVLKLRVDGIEHLAAADVIEAY